MWQKENSSQVEILTSAGDLGKDFKRTEKRGYWTYEGEVPLDFDFEKEILNFFEESKGYGNRRSVFRALVPKGINLPLSLHKNIEAYVPLDNIIGASLDLLIIGENSQENPFQQNDSKLIKWWEGRNTDDVTSYKDLKARSDFFQSGEVTMDDVDALYHLWSIFGWTKSEIRNFISSSSDNPNLWVNTVRGQDSKIVGAAMGERLSLGKIDGFGIIDLIELTEWAVSPTERGKGVGKILVSGLTNNILNDTVFNPDYTSEPIIYAECNTVSRSDIVGYYSGLWPVSKYASSYELARGLVTEYPILKLNVGVEDGKGLVELSDGSKSNLRNFLLSILSEKAIKQIYAN